MSQIEMPAIVCCRGTNPRRVVVSEEEEIILHINIVVPLVLIMYGTGTPYHYCPFIDITVSHVTSVARKKTHEILSTRSELALLNHTTDVFSV